MSTHGIKETEEALQGILMLGLLFWKTFHDGFQMTDIGTMWDTYRNDQAFCDAMKLAYEGYQKIPDEVRDLQLEEALELSTVMISYLPKYLHLLK